MADSGSADTKKKSTRLRGHSLMKMKGAIMKNYLTWAETGRQDGIIYMVGPAGIGKTEILWQICKDLQEKHDQSNAKVVEINIPSAMDPESVAGTPAPGTLEITNAAGEKEIVPVLRMHYREEIVEGMKDGKGAILFLDEVGREAAHLRPLMLKLLSEKKLAGLDVSSMFIICAGNPSDTEHSVDPIEEDASVSSRLITMKTKPDVNEVVKWFNKFSTSHAIVADYLLDFPSMIIGRDSDGNQNTKYHCPRSWFNAAANLHIYGDGDDVSHGTFKDPMTSAILTGIIGSTAMQSLKNYVSKSRPLTVKQVLLGKFGTAIRAVPPTTMKNLAVHLRDKAITAKQADNVSKFLEQIPADTASGFIRESKKLHPKNVKLLMARDYLKKLVKRVSQVPTGPASGATSEEE